jgi:hypothetical protein
MRPRLSLAPRTRLATTSATIQATILIAVLAISGATSAAAQAAQAPGGTPPPDPSRFDISAGYGYLHPVNSDIGGIKYQPINPGAVTPGSATLDSSTIKRTGQAYGKVRSGKPAK